jgi:hypothetical protein
MDPVDDTDAAPEIPESLRRRLWSESGEDPEKFLEALTGAGYGNSRLAGQVNLLIHMLARGRELGWRSKATIGRKTGLNQETLRKLCIQVRGMQDRTAISIADALGWTRTSVRTVLNFGEPVLIASRQVFTEIGLDPLALAYILDRYDLGDPPTRQLAAVIARVLTQDISRTWRDHLIRSIRNSVTRQHAAELGSIAEIESQLDTLRAERDEPADRTALP